MNAIQTTLSRLTLGPVQTHANMAVVPLYAVEASAPDYLLLDQVIAGNAGRITEISEHGSVPELAFENLSDKRVLLVDGEQLIGARQNRVLNISILVPAHGKLTIPVSCCEQGRWAYTGARDFSPSESPLFARARAAKMAGVSASMVREGSRRSDQHRVWRDIAMKSMSLEVDSGTSAMSDVYAQQQHRLEEFTGAFRAAPGQVGAVVAIDGKVAGVELFDAPATFARFFAKMVRSYALDAIETAPAAAATPAAEIAEAFLARLAAASAATFAALGDGEDVRLAGEDVVGGALVADGRVRHLAGFDTAGLANDHQAWRASRVRARSRG
ncbi:MAG: hypothetical protein JNM90_06520 [Burkholderiales bacterium]|nr:hypothetical protein [Burkholderiales bacterium]